MGTRAGLAAAAVAGVLISGLGVTARPGDDQKEKPSRDGTRQLWDDAFTEARPKAVSPSPQTRPARTRTGAVARTGSFVGVTVWRVPEGRGVEVSERAEVDTPVQEGQRVRLSVEASQPGFLYVIDRDRYADGTLGEPTLIFPTTRLRGGDNAVRAGRVVEIPDGADTPPYFTVQRSQPNQMKVRITLLITTERLPGLEIGRNPLKLSPAQVEEWERKWSAPVRKLETPGGAGRSYTKAELEAGQDANRLLTQEDPLPQTLYRVEAQPPKAVLVDVGLRLAKAR
jgi:hypothetical protein